MNYRFILGVSSRHASYRSVKYSCKLGYGVQLYRFLAIAEPESQNHLLTEVIYCSHPATPKRTVRLERGLLARILTILQTDIY